MSPCFTQTAATPRFSLARPVSTPRFLVPSLTLLVGLAVSAGAAAAPGLPSAAEPGREPVRPAMPLSTLGATPVQVPQSPAVEAPPGARDHAFVLTTFQIDGATAFSPEVLRPYYEALLGQRVTVEDVFAAARAIERHYRSAGYVTSQVIVPQQTIEGGLFRVRVLEGFVSEVVFQGEIGPAAAAVERLVGSLRGVKPVSVADIERRLLLANDLPGLTVRGSLEPSASEPGGSVLVVRSERRAAEASLTLDNRMSPYLGRAQAMGSVSWNALGERADRVTLGARTDVRLERLASLSASYDALLTSQGTMLALAASHTRSKPGRELAPLDVKSRVSSLTGTVSVPVLRSREENFRLVGQFEGRNVNTDIAGAAFTEDRLRIVRGGGSYDVSDAFDGITTVRAMLHQGVAGLGATPVGSAMASRGNGRSEFTKLTFDLTRLQQFSARTSLVASVTGQYTERPLLASEEMALGGASFGRAYDDGEVAADTGVAGSLELRHVPAGLPINVQFYGYVDAGRVRAAPGGNVVPSVTLTSWGCGLRTALGDKVYASLEWAKPMSTPVRTQGNKHPRAFVSLTAQF